MKLRKLSSAEIAQLCACLALPSEPYHRRTCPHWRVRRQARWARQAQKWRDGQKAAK